jgi:GTP cyclohydrolase IA
MKEQYEAILKSIGEDVTREGLVKTPERAAKAMQYIMKGYSESVEDVINGAIFESQMDEMVIVKDIELYSMCEHHMLPFFGKCHVAYIPNGKIIGLSKIARVVDVFARRLQVQENLTMQVAEAILKHTGAEGVGVVVEANHLCMMMRGVEKQNSMMKTSCMLGCFREDSKTRMEFLSLIR